MGEVTSEIVVVRERIAAADLAALVERFFGDLVKYVVDVRREVGAGSGEALP